MSVRMNERELRDWWGRASRDVIAELYVDSQRYTGCVGRVPFGRTEVPGGVIERAFEMMDGSPCITLRRLSDGDPAASRVLVGLVGGAPDGPVPDMEVAPLAEAALFEEVRSDWNRIRAAAEADIMEEYDAFTAPENVSRVILEDIYLDDDSLDRASFYRMTKGYGDGELDDLRKRVRSGSEAFYKERYESGCVDRRVVEEELAYNRRNLDILFSDWNRLAGRLDWRLNNLAAHDGKVNAALIVEVARWAMNEPSYVPYRERELRGWVAGAFRLFGEKSELIPPDLKFSFTESFSEKNIKKSQITI